MRLCFVRHGTPLAFCRDMSNRGIHHELLHLQPLRPRSVGSIRAGEKPMGDERALVEQLQSLLGLQPTGQIDPETNAAIQRLRSLFNLDQLEVGGQGAGGASELARGASGSIGEPSASGERGDLGLLVELARQALDRTGGPAGGNLAPAAGAKTPAGSMLGRMYGATSSSGLFRSTSSPRSKDTLEKKHARSAPTTLTPTSTASLRGNTNAEKAFEYFVGKGLTKAQAAGIVGNLQQESAVNPAQRQIGGPAFGIAQWEGPRQRELKRFAAERSAPVEDLGTQLDFMWHELQTTEKGSLAALRETRTASEAAKTFERRYERAGKPNIGARVRHAEEALRSFA